MNEMTLNEFMNLTTAWSNKSGEWLVEITLKDLSKSVLTIDNCNNEYEAKERAFLYLLEKINQHKK